MTEIWGLTERDRCASTGRWSGVRTPRDGPRHPPGTDGRRHHRGDAARGRGRPAREPDGPPTPAGWVGLALAVPAVAVAALSGTERFRRLAFPAVMLLTVLDVVLIVLSGAAVT